MNQHRTSNRPTPTNPRVGDLLTVGVEQNLGALQYCYVSEIERRYTTSVPQDPMHSRLEKSASRYTNSTFNTEVRSIRLIYD